MATAAEEMLLANVVERAWDKLEVKGLTGEQLIDAAKEIAQELYNEASAKRTVVGLVRQESEPDAIRRRALRAQAGVKAAAASSIDLPGVGAVPRGESRHLDLLTTKAAVLQAEDELRQARVAGASQQTVSALVAKVDQVTKAHADATTAAETNAGPGVDGFSKATKAVRETFAAWQGAGMPASGPLHDAYKAAMTAQREALAELKKL